MLGQSKEISCANDAVTHVAHTLCDDFASQEPTRCAWSSIRRLLALNLVHISAGTALALLIQLAAAATGWIKHPNTDASVVNGILDLAGSLLGTILLFQVVNLALLRLPRTRLAANSVLLLLFAALELYHASSAQPLDYFMIADNAALLSFGESWTVLLSRVWGVQPLLLGIGFVAILAAAMHARLLSSWPTPRFYRATQAGTFLLLALVMWIPAYGQNDLLAFARSGLEYHFGTAIVDVDADQQYPYVKRATHASNPNGPRPHIFIVMMESFNANFVETTTQDGREYTPVFNSLIPNGVFIERYYGNGIQTAPGQLALLCSILPSTRGKVFTDRPNLHLRSLAAIVKEYGYNTLFFKGYKSLDFDNTGEFMRKNGFDEVHAMDSSFVTEEDQPFIWGWGLQDDRTYRKVFAFMDRRAEAELNRPDFVVIHTVSHHMPFDHVPKDKRFLFPDAASPQEHFANSTYLADQYLAEFFNQLHERPRYKDSIVIVTGDHSFPAGEHNNFHNETGFYEENFRTPFLLLWPEKLKPRRISEACYSHLDVAPTILDLLKINTQTHFLGCSLLDPPEPSRPIHLIQPYNGTFLAVVQFPFKYVRGLRTPAEHLFNLENDPQERRDLIEDYRNTDSQRRFKAEVGRIRLNQRLVDDDRIWPLEP